MWFPQLIGGIDIEERRPRTFNEPRRKRLNFVRDRKRPSDEWALVSSTNPQPHRQRQTQQDLFNRRQWEAQQRFLNQDRERLFIEQERFRLAHPPLESWPPRPQHHQLDPRMQQLPPAPPHHEHGGGGHHGMQQHPGGGRGGRNDFHDEHDRGHPDDIVAVLSEGNSDDDSDSDDHRGRRKPLTIELKPKIRLPRHFRQPGRSKSRGRKEKKKRRPSSVYSDDSSSEDELFAEGFRAGRRSLSRRPMPRRERSRSRVFELSDDSFEDLALRGRLRSKSRGGGWRR